MHYSNLPRVQTRYIRDTETIALSPDGRSLAIVVSIYAALVTVPQFAKRVIVGRSFDAAALAGEIPNPPFVTYLGLAIAAVLGIACVLIAGRNLLKAARRPPTILIAFMLLILGPLAWGQGFVASWEVVAVNIIFFATLSTIRPNLADLRIFSHIGVAVAGASIVFGLVHESGWRAGTIGSQDTKAFIGTGILAGPFPSSNNLGMSLAMALPFAFLVRGKIKRSASILVMTLALVLSASRASILALVVAAVAVLLVLSFRKASERRVVYWFVVAPTGLLALAMPWVVDSPDAFTSRGAIWIASRELATQEPLIGYGPTAFSRVGVVAQQLGSIAPGGHNTFLHYWVVAGLVGLLVMMWLVCSTAVGGSRLLDISLVPAAFVMVLLVLSSAEQPLRPDTVVGQAWITLPVVALLTSRAINLPKET